MTDAGIKGRDIIIYLSLKYKGDWNMIYEAIKAKEKLDIEAVKVAASSISSGVLTIIDDNYPASLKNTYKPPFCVYYLGDISKLEDTSKSIAFIGDNDSNTIESWKSEISKTHTIVTMFESEKDYEQKTISIASRIFVSKVGLANLEETHKSMIEKIKIGGLIISEYPGFCRAQGDNKTIPYRLMVAISNSLLVGSLKKEANEAAAIGYTLWHGKDIYCAVSKQEDEMLVKLANEGARMVKNPFELLCELERAGIEAHARA